MALRSHWKANKAEVVAENGVVTAMQPQAAEAGLAILIDVSWSKRRILEVYLNIAQFDTAVFGVEAAARHYFGKSARKLNDREAALLAAALPSPERSCEQGIPSRGSTARRSCCSAPSRKFSWSGPRSISAS